MRDALSILDQALSLTQGNELTTAISEEITGTISLSALDDYVAALSQQDVPKALACLNLLFENGKSMTRFVTDLLHYLRDLLIVQQGEKTLIIVQSLWRIWQFIKKICLK